ncbi:MAG: hypothetical protein RIR18_2397 [Pseudomonadota bacterium]
MAAARHFSTLRVSTRMHLLVGVSLIGLFVLCLSALFSMKEGMLIDRQKKTQSLVEAAIGVASHHYSLYKNGVISEDEAKNSARETLRNLRYDDGNYFFAIDERHQLILMPPKPASEGSSQYEVQDARGKHLFQEIVRVGKDGGGFVNYEFPKSGQSTPEPKLSYATAFVPWGWIIGTGIYIDDVNQSFHRHAVTLGGISIILLCCIAFVGWRISSSILGQLGGEPATAVEVMQKVAEGDLTLATVAPPGTLIGSLAEMVGSLRTLVGEIDKRANDLVDHAESIAAAAEQMSCAAESDSDATSSMASAIEQLTVTSSHISDSANETARDSTHAMELTSQGSQRVRNASESIQKIAQTVHGTSEIIGALEARANQVASIANVIKEIAAQTNLLALNAAIEAARAGEQGRGFAVVADEVRKLAERTSTATTEIEQMVAAIQTDTSGAVVAMDSALPAVQEGVRLAGETAESLRAIEAGAQRTLERIGDIANATREQSAASTAIAQQVEEIANRVEESSATMRTTAVSARELEFIAGNLKSLIARFRTL